jgi:quercetin dioxygenase-like cupin family protein
MPDGLRISLNRVQPAVQHPLHWHDTYDLVWLLAGRISIAVDGGDEAELTPGDLVVQRGANHAWRPGPDGAVLGVFVFGARRTGATPAATARRAITGPRPGAAQPFLEASVAELLARRPRRIVTGQRDDGASVIARADEVEPDSRSDGANGVLVHRMWADDAFLDRELPVVGAAVPLSSGSTEATTAEALRTSSRHAKPGGLRVSLLYFLPNEGGRAYPLHWRDTFDFEWLIAGELTLGLDDGSELTLRPGDVVIQQGTSHSWQVGSAGAVVGLVLLGAKRDGVSPPGETRAPSL